MESTAHEGRERGPSWKGLGVPLVQGPVCQAKERKILDVISKYCWVFLLLLLLGGVKGGKVLNKM